MFHNVFGHPLLVIPPERRMEHEGGDDQGGSCQWLVWKLQTLDGVFEQGTAAR